MVCKEKIFLFISFLLGANLFKKYWPFRGSYWNEEHIDKNDPNDLKTIIKDSNEWTRQHAQMALSECIIFMGCILMGINTIRYNIGLMIILGIAHSYAFMIHQYNRILARNQLGRIKKDESNTGEETEEDYIKLKKLTPEEMKERKNKMKKLRDLNGGHAILIRLLSNDYYQLSIREYFTSFGPPLKNLNKITQLREFYYQKIKESDLDILEYLYVYKKSKMYLEFLK